VARIEQTIGKLKRFKRIALRCNKTAISYSAVDLSGQNRFWCRMIGHFRAKLRKKKLLWQQYFTR
jgi:hypothetical protein